MSLRNLTGFSLTIGFDGGKMWGIEGNQIVPKQKGTSIRESIELGERRGQISSVVFERLSGITAHCDEAVNASILGPHFEIDGKAMRREIMSFRCFPGLIVHGDAKILLILESERG
ncbi:MAG: hypothetical protein KDJ54_08125 [Candidatus Competibacteraceae bacterium]|nr:hypothetical protein [Candidatus Competibacteraceae bacterium]